MAVVAVLLDPSHCVLWREICIDCRGVCFPSQSAGGCVFETSLERVFTAFLTIERIPVFVTTKKILLVLTKERSIYGSQLAQYEVILPHVTSCGVFTARESTLQYFYLLSCKLSLYLLIAYNGLKKSKRVSALCNPN